MKLAIYSIVTSGYERALETQARRLVSALANEPRISQENLLVILVTDCADTVKSAYERYVQCLPKADIRVKADEKFISTHKNYGQAAQLKIAQMRTIGTMEALAWGADYCLSMDCDVLPPHNAVRCMIDMLQFDGGYYGAAFCPYPSHGGGAFLGGRGTRFQPILPDFYEDEKDIPKEVKEKQDKCQSELKKIQKSLGKKPPTEDERKQIDDLVETLHQLDKQIRELPPKANVFAANSKKWRRRGWFDSAYPAIGKGAIVPVEWTGFGCLLMNRQALTLCDWAGYEGKGTEDLYINFHRWEPNGIRMCCIPHCPCDHVVRNPRFPEEDSLPFIHVNVGHELDGEYQGHLRQWHTPWYTHAPGEIPHQPKEKTVDKTQESP